MEDKVQKTNRGIAYCRVAATVKGVMDDTGILICMSKLVAEQDPRTVTFRTVIQKRR